MTLLLKRTLRGVMVAGLVVSALPQGRAQVMQGRNAMPQMPAAPLAGGAAAIGDSYVDVHGRSIVMPANYMEPSGSYCGPADGCYGGGDPGAAYVDFGGCAPDQCGPYYFDIAVQTIFLQGEDVFKDVPPLGSIGPSGPTILDPSALNDDYTPGWQIAARYDLGPLSVLEATYMGIYDFGFNQTIRSVDVAPGGLDDFLFTVFSNYGDPDGIPGLDFGSVYTLDYESELQSTELSYRRYWVGYSPRISGTYLAGFRYIRLTEDLTFDILSNSQTLDPATSALLWSADNDLVGFQFGGDGWICLRQGLRLGGETKAGIYNNRYKYRHATAIDDDDDDNDIDFSTAGNEPAFAGEVSLDLVADILPSFSIRGGYKALYMSSLTTVGNNIDTTDVASTQVLTTADVFYHGFQAGLEYIW